MFLYRFDFVIHNKPCLYYNYEQPQLKKGIRDIGQNYDYVHLDPCLPKKPLYSANPNRILSKRVMDILDYKLSNVSQAKLWYKVIAGKHHNRHLQKFGVRFQIF